MTSLPATWERVRKAVKAARRQGRLATEWSLASRGRIEPGTQVRIGEATITLLSGFNRPPKAWGLEGNSNRSKHRNAGSVVLRLEYEGYSVLFTGDAVGRLDDDDDGADCIATERYLLDTLEEDQLRADVVIVPHHGADNASCLRFLEAVRPEYAVFSAGHDHEHPRAQAAERYLAAGVSPDRMLRTDLGDGEGDEEWEEGAGPLGVEDPVGDDDVEILLTAEGVTVRYRDR
jgi:competence protein ComEC